MSHSARLGQQWALMEQRRYQLAASQTELIVAHLSGTDRHDADRLLGLAYYWQRKYTEAANWYERACQGSSDSGDWLDLAIAATLAGNVPEGSEAFAQVRLCQQADKYAQLPGFYRQMLWYVDALMTKQDFEQLWPLLDELAQAYRQLGVSNSVTLYVVGLPFLSTFLDLALRAWRGAKRNAEGRRWLEKLAEGLDMENARKVRIAVESL